MTQSMNERRAFQRCRSRNPVTGNYVNYQQIIRIIVIVIIISSSRMMRYVTVTLFRRRSLTAVQRSSY